MRRIPAYLAAGTAFLFACGSSGGGTTDPGATTDDGADAVETIAIDVPLADLGFEDAALPDEGGDDVLIPVDLAQNDVPIYQDPGGDTPSAGCLANNGHYSNLEGVRIEFTAAECHWLQSQALAGVKIPYQVVIEKDVTLVTPKPQDAGQCDQPGPSGLILLEKLEGDNQTYCKCDSGLCEGATQTVTLTAGTYPGEFEWHGRNWQGPSDTGNPEGNPFPAGKYTLTVSAKGEAKIFGVKQDFEVSATFTVEVSDDPLPELPEPEPDVPAQDFYIPGEPSPDDVPIAETQT